MGKSALVASQRVVAAQGSPEAAFYEAKVATARYFITQTLPAAMGLEASVRGRVDALMAVDLDQY